MSTTIPENPLLRRPALACGAAVVGMTLLVLVSPWLPSGRPTGERVMVATRDLHFADRADGAVVVTEAATNSPVMVLEPGQDGFVRGTMRGLARDRKGRDIGSEAPFRLTSWNDGYLTLEDRATGRTLELIGFGATNAHAFARFLPNKE